MRTGEKFSNDLSAKEHLLNSKTLCARTHTHRRKNPLLLVFAEMSSTRASFSFSFSSSSLTSSSSSSFCRRRRRRRHRARINQTRCRASGGGGGGGGGIGGGGGGGGGKAGTLKREQVIDRRERGKLNESDDALWYSQPRFCTHVDDGFLEQLTRLYRQRTTPEYKCLDLCSSHVSHYPYEYEYVLGHGLNREELSRNGAFQGNFFVRNFNENPTIDAPDQTFDMVSMCVSIQYMQRAEELFKEIFRVLKPGGVVIISYSNRMFYEKALSVWRDGTGYSRTQLVKSYFQNVSGFTEPEVITEVLPDGVEDEKNVFVKIMKTFMKRASSDPFYAVVSYRNFKRVE